MTGLLIVVGIFFLVTLVLTILVAGSLHATSDDYFVAGRSLPWWAIGSTYALVGLPLLMLTLSTVWNAETAHGGRLLFLVPVTFLAVMGLPFLHRKRLFVTVEYLDARFDGATRGLFTFLMAVFILVGVAVPALWCMSVLIQVTGDLLSAGPWFYWTMLVLAVVLATTMACLGGLATTVIGGVVAVVVFLLAGVVTAICSLSQAGASATWDVGTGNFALVGSLGGDWLLAFLVGALLFWSFGLSPHAVGRFHGARSEWDARFSAVFGGLLLIVMLAFSGLMVGLLLTGQQEQGMPESVLVKLVGTLLGSGFMGQMAIGLIFCAFLGVAMHVFASAMSSLSTLWTMGVYQPIYGHTASESDLVRMGRIVVNLTALLAIGGFFLMRLLFDPSVRGPVSTVPEGLLIVLACFVIPYLVIFLIGFLLRKAHCRAARVTLFFGIIGGGLLYVVGNVPGWAARSLSPSDPQVQEWLAGPGINEFAAGLQSDAKNNPAIKTRCTAMIGQLGAKPKVIVEVLKDQTLRENLAAQEDIQPLVHSALVAACKDEAVRKRIATTPDFRDRLVENAGARASLDVMLKHNVGDMLVRDKIKEDPTLRAAVIADPAVLEAFARDENASVAISKDDAYLDAVGTSKAYLLTMIEDVAIQKEMQKPGNAISLILENDVLTGLRAHEKINQWFSFVPEKYRCYIVEGFRFLHAPGGWAAADWAFCLFVMVGLSLFTQPGGVERYDPDAIWGPFWARLPADEAEEVGFFGSITIWWLLLAGLTAGLLIFLG